MGHGICFPIFQLVEDCHCEHQFPLWSVGVALRMAAINNLIWGTTENFDNKKKITLTQLLAWPWQCFCLSEMVVGTVYILP